jgi:signal transduction histidine kinase
MRVLCVEDDPASRQYITDTIAAAGHEICTAENGLVGLQCYNSFRPDLVLSDIRMPEMDGIELLSALRMRNERVSVVMMTAYGSEDYAVKALRAGANDYLKKPVRHADLLPLLGKYAELSIEEHPTNLARMNERLLSLNLELRQEMKNQADLLAQNEKMASLGTLSASIAHEISNSMLLVIGNLSCLTDSSGKIKELLGKYQAIEKILRGKKHSNIVCRQIEELINNRQLAQMQQEVISLMDEAMDGAMQVDVLLKDLKSFARVDRAEFGPVNLNERLDFILKMIRSRMKHKILILKDYNALPLVRCSSQKIGQAFMNILLNAEQAIDAHGTITITSRVLPPTKERDEYWAEILFADTGRGISPDNLERVFEPFFTTRPAGECTGLGMLITRDIIMNHGGTIAIDSVEGKGTTVTVRLPTGELATSE